MSGTSAMRQQVLSLWMAGSALDENVIAWAFHDGTNGTGPALPDPPQAGGPPYSTGLRALQDGWMLIQSAQLIPPAPGQERENSYLEYEFIFERRVDISEEVNALDLGE
ncbi:hypothetical protein [uncultured Ilumatobacter sp.]|uniref:hypothetical protein n=1 Tax=uncultured Ilumatobacter sp. TaxID=879968 RepID=UPI00374EE018